VGGVTEGLPVVGDALGGEGGGPLDQVQDTVGGVTEGLPVVGGGGEAVDPSIRCRTPWAA
jgi:hypothetical protein